MAVELDPEDLPGLGVGHPSRVDVNRGPEPEGADLGRGEEGVVQVVTAGAAGLFGLEEDAVDCAFPSLGPPEGVLGILGPQLGVFEHDTGGGGGGAALDVPEMVDDPGRLAVVVLILDVEARRGGVDHDEIGLVLDHGGFHHDRPVIPAKLVLAEDEVGPHQGRVGAASGMPRPPKILDAVGVGVLLIEVEDFDRLGLVAEERTACGERRRQAVGEKGLAGAGLACEGDEGTPREEVFDEPLDRGIIAGEEIVDGKALYCWGGSGCHTEGPTFLPPAGRGAHDYIRELTEGRRGV